MRKRKGRDAASKDAKTPRGKGARRKDGPPGTARPERRPRPRSAGDSRTDRTDRAASGRDSGPGPRGQDPAVAAIPSLSAALLDPQASVRRQAAASLTAAVETACVAGEASSRKGAKPGALPDAPALAAIPHLVAAAAAPEPEVCDAVASALSRVRTGYEDLHPLLFHPNAGIRRAVFAAFREGNARVWSWPEKTRAAFHTHLTAYIAGLAGQAGPQSPAGRAFAAPARRGERHWPLHVAAAAGDADLVILLLGSGFDSSTMDGTGTLPLMYHLERTAIDPAVVRALVTPDQLRRRDPRGDTMLHLAVRGRHWDAVALLVEAGADRAQRDAAGLTPEELAREAGAPPATRERLRPDDPTKAGPRWGAMLMNSLAVQMPPITTAELAAAVERQREFATRGGDSRAWAPARCEGGLHLASLPGPGPRPATLAYTNFAGADLRRLSLPWADLTGSSARGQDLSGACLSHGMLIDADFTAASLRGARLSHADLSRARLVGCDLREADLTGADLERADLTRADLRGARREGARLDGARLDGAVLEGDPGAPRPAPPPAPPAPIDPPGAPAEAALHLLCGAVAGEDLLPLAPLLLRLLAVPEAADRAAAALAALGLQAPRARATLLERVREPSPAPPDLVDRVLTWLKARTLRLPNLCWRWGGGDHSVQLAGDRLIWQVAEARIEQPVADLAAQGPPDVGAPAAIRLGLAQFVRAPVSSALARERWLEALPVGRPARTGSGCGTCGGLGETEQADGREGEALSGSTDRLRTLARRGSRQELRVCPACAALFHWENDYEFMGWDDYSLRRIGTEEARRLVESDEWSFGT